MISLSYLVSPGIRKIFFLIVFCGYGFLSFSQTLSGKVIGKEDKPIGNAGIILKNSDGKPVNYVYSDNKGLFLFSDIPQGYYVLQVTALGYQKQFLNVTVSKDKQNIQIYLSENAEELPEIIIQTKPPIVQRKDTVVFDVKTFADGTEKVLEDLLKKLPGLQISQDGIIKYGDQEIEKIMVEGDDFFEKGYRVLSKNMPVHPLEEVELLKNYSNNKHLKGIENSNKVALNLKLNEDAKREWFGNIDTGYGVLSENRYNVRTNLMNFGKQDKYYFLSNLNNLGYNVTGDLSSLVYSTSDPVVGDGQSANELLNINASTPSLRDERTNLNNSEILSLNSIFNLSETLKLKIIGFINTDEQDFWRNSYDTFSDGTVSFDNLEEYRMRHKLQNLFGRIDLQKDISKNTSLESSVKYNYRNNHDKSQLKFNGSDIEEVLRTENNLLDAKTLLTFRTNSSKVWLFSGRFIQEETPQHYHINQFVYQDLFSVEGDAVGQSSSNKMRFAGVDARHIHRYRNNNLLEIRFANEYRKDLLNTRMSIEDFSGESLYPENFQNNLSFQSNDLSAQLSYTFQWRTIRLLTSLQTKYLYQSVQKTERDKDFHSLQFIPSFSGEWNINRHNLLRISYSRNISNSTITDMFPNYIHSAFRFFSNGYNDFTQFAQHHTSVHYTLGNWNDRFFLNSSVGYTHADQYFSGQSVVMPNYSVDNAIILQDKSSWSAQTSANYYFRFIKSNLKVKADFQLTSYQNFVNDSGIRTIKTANFDYGTELRSAFRGAFNYHIGNMWNTSQFQTNSVAEYTNQRAFVNFTFRINDNTYILIRNERYYFGNLSSENDTFLFSDFIVNYKLGNIHWNFEINNIFNNDTFVSYNLTDISVSQTSYRIIPRYALLSVEFRF